MQILEGIVIAKVFGDCGGGSIVSCDDEIGDGDITAGTHTGNAARGEVSCDRLLNHGVDGRAIVHESWSGPGIRCDEVEGARVDRAFVDFGRSSGGSNGCPGNQSEKEEWVCFHRI